MKHLIYTPVIIILALVSCEQKSEYEQLLQQEMNKGVRYDSLFLGYKFGMEREHFFDYSWQLNQQGIITGGTQIEYQLTDLSGTARMVFFPAFHNDKIYKMPIEISFNSWAPWNREYFSDNLIKELVVLYEDIYGEGFIKATHPEMNREAWIKIDGNRRISIFPKDDMIARIEFLDLSVEK